jgi:hypothetical protein
MIFCRMKLRMLGLLAVVVSGIAGVMIHRHGNRERWFLERAFVQLRGGSGTEPVAVIDLGSGESASVILEHGCCSGGGFDAVAIRTSDGSEFHSTLNYCGLEDFRFAVEAEATAGLAAFKSFLTRQGYREQRKGAVP